MLALSSLDLAARRSHGVNAGAEAVFSEDSDKDKYELKQRVDSSGADRAGGNFQLTIRQLLQGDTNEKLKRISNTKTTTNPN